ncbi:MAG: N-6 DNA methylase, partial [Syntrophomonadaceae bacterium]
GLCKMNMLFHNIFDSKILNGDTLLNPLHTENGELKTFDIVIANPPFSQDYTTTNMKYTERFIFKMPTKGKADFMFVQHMVASLNNAGRMAVVMPHGVLYRGGEEKKFREWLVNRGYLEAIIGMPPALFYGTGIGACVLVINKANAYERDHVLFINADREYKEGKNQNKLRPEDIEKIAYTYKHKIETPKYSRLVARSKAIDETNNLENEDFNFNIRRFVDNAPPPEPQDVYAHLHGGIPENEVNALEAWFDCYSLLQEKLFEPLKENYLKFKENIDTAEVIKKLFDESEEIKAAHAQYENAINDWWQSQTSAIEQLPKGEANIFDLYNDFSDTLTEKLISLPILDSFKSRGSFAAFWSSISNDIKSVIASGWNAELIPDDEILQSQFPEVLKDLKENENRRDEIQAMFDEVNELEEEAWNEEDYEVWRAKELKEHKNAIKELKGKRHEADKEYKNLQKRIKANERALKKQPELASEIARLQQEAEKQQAEVERLNAVIAADENRIAKHNELEEELKLCRRKIKNIKNLKQVLVDQARRRLITDEKAKELILKRWLKTLQDTVNGYLQTHKRELLQAVENLWQKYTTPISSILSEREEETQLLNQYLRELGYE